MKTQVAKKIIGQFAGDAMQGYFKGLFGTAGRVGKAATQGALNYGRSVIAPGATTSQIPKLLRAGANSPLPQLGYYGGQAALAGGVLAAVNSLDQQSEYSQPMNSGTGNKDMNNFLMNQQLQNQKFMHEMALVQARAESRIPGAQYPGSLNTGMNDRAFEKSILDEVGVFGRGLYGTGLRA